MVLSTVAVALRKESVDRNQSKRLRTKSQDASLSARRAWIEIANILCRTADALVALRKESVDRNSKHVNISYAEASRSPQGERG